MFGASETTYDLRFRFLNVPVRIHPMFWLVAAVLGWQDRALPLTALWVAWVLVSVLVHEYGHALMAKLFGCSPSVVLWGLGGLCYSEAERQTPLQRLAVILAGPGAGFMLAGVVVTLMWLFVGISPAEQAPAIVAIVTFTHLPFEFALKVHDAVGSSQLAWTFVLNSYRFLIWINVMWGLINLLPLWPLDGGQATQILLTFIDRGRGRRWGHVVSLLTAGVLGVLAFSRTKDLFLTMFFGYFAFVNYQVLQTMHQAHSMGLYQEEDWWRR